MNSLRILSLCLPKERKRKECPERSKSCKSQTPFLRLGGRQDPHTSMALSQEEHTHKLAHTPHTHTHYTHTHTPAWTLCSLRARFDATVPHTSRAVRARIYAMNCLVATEFHIPYAIEMLGYFFAQHDPLVLLVC